VKIEIHELAVQEFDDAIEWYEIQFPGLGARFRKEVVTQIRKAAKNPTWYLREEENIYKVYIPKFPYKVLYTSSENKIIVWSIAHLHRKPWYWQSRMK